VRSSGGFSSKVYYYDGEDQLVGASFWTDVPSYCEDTSFAIDLGTVPDCERIKDVDLCPPPAPVR
jgi:hypothetical protein